MTEISESILAEEVRIWNTPLYGAYLLWNFTTAYCASHARGDAPVGILHFLAMPMLANRQLNASISDRRKNLQSYVQGFEDGKQSDILLSLQERVRSKKENTLACIDAGIYAGLLSWDSSSGKIYPHVLEAESKRGKAIRPSIAKEGRKAIILGRWFSEHDVPTVASYLRVVL
jgi:hypothetical protein